MKGYVNNFSVVENMAEAEVEVVKYGHVEGRV
jgi:hypothetical protein